MRAKNGPSQEEKDNTMGVEVLVPTGFFLMIAVIVWIVQSNGTRKRAEAQQTLRTAIEKGQPISEELLERMTQATANPHGDLRRGVISLAIAGGFGALAVLVGRHEQEAVTPLLGIGAFPLFLGIAFLILHVFTGRSTRR
jgi:hypothetical protein